MAELLNRHQERERRATYKLAAFAASVWVKKLDQRSACTSPGPYLDLFDKNTFDIASSEHCNVRNRRHHAVDRNHAGKIMEEDRMRQKARILLSMTKALQARGKAPYSLDTLCRISQVGAIDEVYTEVYRHGIALLSQFVDDPKFIGTQNMIVIDRNIKSIKARDRTIYYFHRLFR